MTDNELRLSGAASREDPLFVALCPDLFFASKLRGAATAVGRSVRIVRDQDALLAAAEGAIRVFVDLTAASDGASAIAALKGASGGVEVVAFARHDAVDDIRAARAAGADRVLARSAFVKELPGLLAE
ncbi:MAG TPA: hypothetical protein VK837_11590 [Longimicrobiales bacterium]|nr:hypothetical protein [Longimicrobiales bacterium]